MRPVTEGPVSDTTRDPSGTIRSDRVGLAGYGCLVALSLGGGLGGAGLLLAGIGTYATSAGRTLAAAHEAPEFARSLERAVVLCGFGALAVLIGVVAAVVLLKELGDDAARAARGPLRQ